MKVSVQALSITAVMISALFYSNRERRGEERREGDRGAFCARGQKMMRKSYDNL
jgi:hypothetical protein